MVSPWWGVREKKEGKGKKRVSTAEERLDSLIFEYSGEDSSTIKQSLHQEPNPTEAAQHLLTWLEDNMEEDAEVQALIGELHLSEVGVTPEARPSDRWHSIPDPNLSNNRDNYREFGQDVRGEVIPIFFTEQSPLKAEWRRLTAGTDMHSIRMVCEYGNFDLSVTEANAKSVMRVRVHFDRKQKDQPCLSVGAVELNFATNKVQCLVYGCKHIGYIPDTDNREFQEFFVLRILYHLGSHNKGKNPHFPRITAPPAKQRDTEEMKWLTRSRIEDLRVIASLGR